MIKILLITTFIFQSFIALSQVDNLGHKIIEQSFNLLEDYIKNPNSSTSTQRAEIIHFFTYLTGIPSNSDGDYSGQSSPTKEDILNWRKWFIINKDYISWDKEKKQVILTKSVPAPNTSAFAQE